MTTLMWGERGLVSTFFADLGDDAAPLWTQFLSLIGFHLAGEIKNVWCVVEPDFGSRGFGKPDVIAKIEFENETISDFVFVMEAKRDSYRLTSIPCANQFDQGFNSSANGQIELNHRLAMCLALFHQGDSCLTESNWISDSIYTGPDDNLRRLSDLVVLEKLVEKVCGLPIENYIHVLIDESPGNPLVDPGISDDRKPRIYDQTGNCRDDFVANRFLWVAWSQLHEFAIEKQMARFLASYELNKEKLGCSSSNPERLPYQLDGLNRGVAAVRIHKNDCFKTSRIVHFSWDGNSCRIRDFLRHTGAPPASNPLRTDEVVQSVDVLKVYRSDRVSVGDHAWWREELLKLTMGSELG